MTAPLSQDLRIRIRRAVEAGSSRRCAAMRFEVSPSAVIKLMRRVRESGSTAPAQIGGARRRWRGWQGYMDGRLVFLDESGVQTNMVRRYGWGPKSQRLVATVPQGHWRSLTFVAGLRAGGVVAPFFVGGGVG